MNFDLRQLIGTLLSLIGLLLITQGLAEPSLAPGSIGMPVNFVWGCVVMASGLTLIWIASRW